MQLTYLINEIDYGGAEMGMVRLLSELRADEFEVTVLTLKGCNPSLADALPDYVSLRSLELTEGIGLRPFQTLVQTFRNTDVLVCSLFPSIVVGAVVGSFVRVPEIYSWKHNTTEGSRWSRILNQVSFRFSDVALVDSDATKELLTEWGISDHRIRKLPIAGIDVADYPNVGHHQTGTDVRFGTVGSLTLQKGYPELLECAERLPDHEFHIVGNGPLAAELENGPDNVVLHGNVSQDELQALWASFDVYFQPSRWEGLCITAIEGMASGLPVVASQVDGLTESVIDGETGFLVPQGDIEGYCSQLTRLSDDPELRNRMGRAGRTRVQNKYSAKAFADAFRELVAESTP